MFISLIIVPFVQSEKYLRNSFQTNKPIDLYDELIKKYKNHYLFNSLMTSYSNEMGITEKNKDWLNSLSDDSFEIQNNRIKSLFCTSETQAILLYCNMWGSFWNEPLHNGKEPEDTRLTNSIFDANLFQCDDNLIRGSDYKYLESAISKGQSPNFDLYVYHGVEYMENNIYKQLEPFINGDNFSGCIGKKFNSPGFISTTTNKNYCIEFSNGYNWNTDQFEPPFKTNVVFKILVPKNTNGVAYISGQRLTKHRTLSICHTNVENQFVINMNRDYLVTGVDKIDNTQILEVTLL